MWPTSHSMIYGYISKWQITILWQCYVLISMNKDMKRIKPASTAVLQLPWQWLLKQGSCYSLTVSLHKVQVPSIFTNGCVKLEKQMILLNHFCFYTTAYGYWLCTLWGPVLPTTTISMTHCYKQVRCNDWFKEEYQIFYIYATYATIYAIILHQFYSMTSPTMTFRIRTVPGTVLFWFYNIKL